MSQAQRALVVLKSLSALKCRHNFCHLKGEDSPGQGKKQNSRRIIMQGVFLREAMVHLLGDVCADLLLLKNLIPGGSEQSACC